ncbi:MAG: methyltransferase [Saprospiraceae bacterium]
MQNSPFIQAFQIVAGFAFTQAAKAFFELGMPDFLKDETRSTDEIAAHCDTHPETTFRFLRFLSKQGLVELEGHNCRLTAVGSMFRSDVPGNLTKALQIGTFEPWQQTWAKLGYTLRTGEKAFTHVHGMEPWEFLEKHPQYGKPFNEYQTHLSKMGAAALVAAYDFSVFKTICDVGGGQGFMLKTILEKHPQPKGILFDLPFVVESADLGPVAGRCEVVGGSFFEKVPSADCIILKSILHDWSDDKALEILRTCAVSLLPGGKILAMDMVIMEGGNPMSYFYDMHMLVLLGGRERTQEEMHELFGKAGLKISRFIPTQGPQFIVEAEKM